MANHLLAIRWDSCSRAAGAIAQPEPRRRSGDRFVATLLTTISDEQRALIESSKLFFVASADPTLQPGDSGQGPVNLSPKGGTPLHVVDEHTVAYLDYEGSGNETARHSARGGPVTLMIMSMDGQDAAIVRLYGHTTASPLDQSPLRDQLLASPAEDLHLPQRQVIRVAIDHTQTSCGYGVPIYAYVAERTEAERGRQYKGG